MTLRLFIDYATSEISRQYDRREAKAIVLRLLADHYNREEAELSMYLSEMIEKESLLSLLEKLKRLKNHEPIQYVTAKAYFDNLVLDIEAPVLIPRPETEELVQLIAKHIHSTFEKDKKIRILDIGTGSGCIALALKNIFPKTEITAVDIDEKALALVRKNSEKLGLNIHLQQHDILNDDIEGTFDIIVSNPPYVRESEKELMRANVIDFESEKALFVPDNDALMFYKKIAAISERNLVSKGYVFLEINKALGDETAAVFKDTVFTKPKILKDFREKVRFVITHLK